MKDRLDEAWQSIKAGLVQGLSIGFKPLEVSQIQETFGLRFIRWLWLELSAVTIPANAEATIRTVKSLDTKQRAATGKKAPPSIVQLTPPGVSGSSKPKTPEEGKQMKTIAEQISALESKRAANVAAQQTVMQKSIEAGRSTEQSEQDEFDTLHLRRYRARSDSAHGFMVLGELRR